MARDAIPTSAPIPVDPEFERIFIESGWQRVERMWGKRRVQTWAMAVGKEQLIQKRRAHLAGIKLAGTVTPPAGERRYRAPAQ